MLVWFLLTAVSVLFVLWDSISNAVTSWVQRLAWVLVTLYAGPVGAFLYLLTCRRPFPGGHDLYTAPTWKQAVNSEMRCLAGDATGIIIAASIVPILALANGWDMLIEYSAGFFVGLFVFQALMMAGMYGGRYFLAVRKTFFAETVSMNMVMAGMIPMMLILSHLWPGSESPANPEFWFRMSLATLAGGLLAYPINYWLVARHLKHGCMTLPGADGPAPHLGHRGHEAANALPAESRDRHSMPGMSMASHDQMQMGHIGSLPAIGIAVGTFAILFGAIWLVSQWVPLSFA
ncbi:MAG: DUF4396 domain-containing protein [Pseudomonadota bacterium]